MKVLGKIKRGETMNNDRVESIFACHALILLTTFISRAYSDTYVISFDFVVMM